MPLCHPVLLTVLRFRTRIQVHDLIVNGVLLGEARPTNFRLKVLKPISVLYCKLHFSFIYFIFVANIFICLCLVIVSTSRVIFSVSCAFVFLYLLCYPWLCILIPALDLLYKLSYDD